METLELASVLLKMFWGGIRRILTPGSSRGGCGSNQVEIGLTLRTLQVATVRAPYFSGTGYVTTEPGAARLQHPGTSPGTDNQGRITRGDNQGTARLFTGMQRDVKVTSARRAGYG